MAYARIPKLLASRYDIEDRYLIWPGRVHQVALILGVLALGLALVLGTPIHD